jgi:serine/threonine-protein kinase
VPLLEGITRSSNTLFGTAQFSVSNNGSLIYVTGPAVITNDARGESVLWTFPGYNPRRRLVWVDRQGREQPISAPPRAYLYPRISPDGTRLAVDVRDAVRDQYQNIVVWDFSRETLTPLIVDALYPLWTRDGKHIVYGSGRDSPGRFFVNLYRQAADGSGDAERLTESPNDQAPHSFTPDGKQLIMRQISGGGASGFDLSLLNLETAHHRSEQTQSSTGPKPLLATKFSENNPELSPDGRWLAYESDESGHTEIYVRPFPNVDAGKFPVSSSGGSRPVWAANGRELFYLAGRTPDPIGLMSVAVQPGRTLALGKPQRLFQGPYLAFATNVTGRTYNVSPDGKRFLMIDNRILDAGDQPLAPSQIFVVLNWFEELRQRVPRAK